MCGSIGHYDAGREGDPTSLAAEKGRTDFGLSLVDKGFTGRREEIGRVNSSSYHFTAIFSICFNFSQDDIEFDDVVSNC